MYKKLCTIEPAKQKWDSVLRQVKKELLHFPAFVNYRKGDVSSTVQNLLRDYQAEFFDAALERDLTEPPAPLSMHSP